jgi:hypothetical protein
MLHLSCVDQPVEDGVEDLEEKNMLNTCVIKWMAQRSLCKNLSDKKRDFNCT